MTTRGQLRVYLGAAPGVGKTYKMLEEGHRRLERGTDVVVGFVESHGRQHTEALLAGLEVVPRKTIDYRGAVVHRDGRRRGPGPPARGRAGRRAGPHQRARVAQRQALAGHRGAARRRHHRHHHGQHPAPGVAQRRRPADHRRAAAGDRAGRGGPPGRPDRAGRHDPGGAAPPDGARQHLHARRRSTRRWATTSGSATSPRCASWPCCGWPTRSTSSSTGTAPSTASTRPGRPANGSSSR